MTKRSTPTMAQKADRHELYQLSVQSPEFELDFFDARYRELRGKRPLILREDFCGTALVCAQWAKSHPKRQAIGVDLCAETLEWGLKHNVRPAGKDVARRIKLINANVLTADAPKADVTCAMNFSYMIFTRRGALRHYFETVRAGLKDNGLFFLDLLGGLETPNAVAEEREIEGEDFTYTWDQATYNPITNEMQCYIHFGFPDGSKLKRAFSYYWRLWSLPEIRELLHEAGFSKVRIYWEEFEEDENDEEYLVGSGNYLEVTEVETQEAWIAYIVAEA
ncbi:MAG TPA: class I SAM-dependent methyltransferase [Gammaproteobacteria bacterium]|nr:class I SAM-dependent methyltransferase [Gammaproteobacteria bacterium]